MKTKTQLCQRCKRELEWEEKARINNLSREILVKSVFALREEIKKLQEGK